MTESSNAVARVTYATQSGLLSPGAADNVVRWLTDARYAEEAGLVAEHVTDGKWSELEDAFWTVLPFGTAGRRGKMFPIGPGAINRRTIGESAQGLADYVRRKAGDATQLRCAVAYDTRHKSREFAELCAEVMAAAGFRVYFLDGHRSTPALAFTVREKVCQCGIMISASHNPPSDNAIKVFWSHGGQLRPPHDEGVIACVEQVTDIRRKEFQAALASGQIVCCQDEIDEKYVAAVRRAGYAGPRALKILYSPLHGVGLTNVVPTLAADRFDDVEIYAPHATPDGDFPNVPGQIANPENPAVFDVLIERAIEIGADIALASDPDADRLGCAAPLTTGGAWRILNGNQIAVLLAEFLLSRREAAGKLSAGDYLIKTLVTTDMVRAVGDSYGVTTHSGVLTGFKWIGSLVDELGPEHFILGAEEAHGYLAGTHVRDKDGAVAAMLLAEFAAQLKAEGRTLHEDLGRLFRKHGVFAEKTTALTMPGADGMQQMGDIMARLRHDPPKQLAGLAVERVLDYLDPANTPRGDVLIFELAAPYCRAAVRPSGTEPKIKFYLFAHTSPDVVSEFDAAQLVEQMERDLLAFGVR